MLRALGEFVSTLGESSLPAEVWHAAKRSLIDWFAAVIPGAAVAPTTLLVRVLEEEIGHGGSRLYPSGQRATVRAAALINGTAAHAVEFDDIFRDGMVHPGAPVIAAALAVADARHQSGVMLLRSIVAGYEVATRMAVALGPAHYRFWHTTGTVGTLGAAAAAAGCIALAPDRTAHALANAATFAAGLQQAFRSDSMSKPLHAGRAAESGTLAAIAAEEGITGAHDVLDGPAGLGAAMSGGTADWSHAMDGLGERYDITRITVKNHGCCGHTFAAIDGTLVLRKDHSLTADNVDTIAVATYQTALDVTGNAHPITSAEARFSLPYVVSTALVHGSVRLDAFSQDRLADPAVRRLMQRITVSVDPALDALFPRQRAARVTVRMRTGHLFEHLQTTRKGDPDAPLSDDELAGKFRELTAPVLGASGTERLLSALWAAERAESPRAWLEPVRVATGVAGAGP